MGSKKPAEGVELDVPSTHQQYLEKTLGEESEAPVFGASQNPVDSTLNADGFVGVDPVYQNFANDTDEPLAAEEGPDKLAEEAYADAVEGGPREASDALKENFSSVSRVENPKDESADASADDEGDEEEEEVPPPAGGNSSSQ